MKIDRSALVRAFDTFVQDGDGAVIGPPGSGKSYLLRGLAERALDDAEAYCLFFPVDRIPLESDAELKQELGTRLDVLAFAATEAASAKRAYFVVDALDAARSERSRAFFINLIRRAVRQL